MATTALAGVTVRLDAWRRIELADRLIDLVTAAMLLWHPEADRLSRLRVTDFYTAKTDAALIRGIGKLTAFVKSRAEDGIGLPSWHCCYLAPIDGEGQ